MRLKVLFLDGVRLKKRGGSRLLLSKVRGSFGLVKKKIGKLILAMVSLGVAPELLAIEEQGALIAHN